MKENWTSDRHTILIGKGINCDQSYKLIINARDMNINETITEREWNLIHLSLIGASEYYENDIQRLNKILSLRKNKLKRILNND